MSFFLRHCWFVTSLVCVVLVLAGCGFLGVPWSFQQVGIIAGSVLMAALTYLCLITVSYILDTIRSAEALTRAKLDPVNHSIQPEYLISARKFELVELVEMFLVRTPLLCVVRIGSSKPTCPQLRTRRRAHRAIV